MPDEDQAPVKPNVYRSRVSNMRNAILIIGFIGYFLLAQVWATFGYYNTWYYLGGWGLFFVFVMFLWGPLVVAARSPKFSSTKIGGTIALPQPILTVPAQGGWPEMVMYDPGSVRGLGIEEHKMGAKGYVWLPWMLAIILGEGGRGVNVNANCKLVQLGEHCELAPHLYDTMVQYTKYKPDVPVWVGLFPELINSPTPEQLEYFKRRCEDFGISRKAFEGDDKRPAFRAVLEEFASTLSKFKYPILTDAPDKLLDNIMKSQNSQIETLRKEIDVWKSDVSALHDLAKYRQEPQREPNWWEKMPGAGREERRPPPREEPDEGRRY